MPRLDIRQFIWCCNLFISRRNYILGRKMEISHASNKFGSFWNSQSSAALLCINQYRLSAAGGYYQYMFVYLARQKPA